METIKRNSIILVLLGLTVFVTAQGETNYGNCDANPCGTGTCMPDPGTNSYTCMCPPEKSGQHCEMPNTATSGTGSNTGTCYTGVCGTGTCFQDTATTYTCQCPTEMSGLHCEIHVPNTGTGTNSGTCEATTCGSGTCMPDPAGANTYTCICPPEKSGQHCEMPNTATSDLGPFYGTCSDGACGAGTCYADPTGSSYTCQCPTLMTGQYCSKHYTGTSGPFSGTCTDSGACGAGTCHPDATHSSYTCECPSGMTGQDCSLPYTDTSGDHNSICDSNPCQREGMCHEDTSLAEGFRCDCPPWAMGTHCEYDQTSFDPCSPDYNICGSGGTCTRDGTAYSDFTCNCYQGYYGKLCRKEADPNKVMIHAKDCEVGTITAGKQLSVQELCAQETAKQFSAKVTGAQSGEYTIEIVQHYKGADTAVSTSVTLTAGDNDVTADVGAMLISAPNSDTETVGSIERVICSNLDMELSMKITSMTDTTQMHHTDSITVRVLCDIKDTDLVVKTLDENPVPEITVTGPSPRLGDLMTPQFEVLNAGTEPLPILPHDAKYYAVLFLTGRTVTPPSGCASNMDVPELTVGDKILWYKTFKDLEELTSISDELKDVEIPTAKYCGYVYGILLVEAIVSLPGENRCNNYEVIPLRFDDCTGTAYESECFVVPHIFDNGRGSGFISKRFSYTAATAMDDLKIYKNEVHGRWKQEKDSYTDEVERKSYMNNLQGLGRLMLLEQNVRNMIKDGTLQCGDSDAIVDEMESLEPEALANPGNALENMIPSYFDALSKGESLRGGTNPDEIIGEVDAEVTSLVPLAPESPFPEHLHYFVQQEALNAVKEIAIAKKDDRLMDMKMETRYALCYAGDIMLSLKHIKEMREDYHDETTRAHFNEELKMKMVDITSNMIKMHYFFPDARFVSCMDKMYERALKFVNDELQDGDWLLDSCGKELNSCLMKVKELCSSHDDYCHSKKTIRDDKDLCVLSHLKTIMKNQWRALGYHDIQKRLRSIKTSMENKLTFRNGQLGLNGDWGGRCNGEEAAIPKAGPVYVYNVHADGSVMKGVPTLDGSEICYNKVAVCTCTPCANPPASGTYKKRKRK